MTSGPRRRWALYASYAAAWAILAFMIFYELSPALGEWHTVGGHDWDQMESHRYLATKTIRRFHQFPFWDPYSCGGHTSWAGLESGTTIVSPWFPAYLLLPLPIALRIEVVGSALLSALGAWLLAGRFTQSAAGRALVAVAFSVNGRWALQIAAGHTWHLAYGLSPWALYFYDRAVGVDPRIGPPRRRFAVLTGLALALMVYAGGIYPVPQTVVVIAIYGAALAIRLRSWQPIGKGLLAASVAFGLAAPKLLPMLDMLRRFPRLVESTETIDLTALIAILTAPDQDMGSHPANVPQYGWHEYGMYVGWVITLLALAAVLFGRGLRESPLKWAGIFCFVCGFGAFDPHAPWPLLHELPIFKSQHVPTRWQYPGMLLLMVAFAGLLERLLARTRGLRHVLEIVLLALTYVVASDVARVARQPITHMFATAMPASKDTRDPFHTEVQLPPVFDYDAGYAPPSLPAEMQNFGTIHCATFPGLNDWVRDEKGHTPGLGAHGRGDPLYRGEVYVAEGTGTASFRAWSPNVLEVEVTGAKPGEHVIVNQNWDPGWTANGRKVLDWADLVASEIKLPNQVIVFRYVPTFFWAGMAITLVTVSSLAFAWFAPRLRVEAAVAAAAAPLSSAR